MGDVIERDFGKNDREFARHLGKILKLVEDRDADILANPGKYFEMASKRLAEAERLKADLYNAVHVPWMAATAGFDQPPTLLEPDIVRIDRRDYEVLQAVKTIVRERCL